MTRKTTCVCTCALKAFKLTIGTAQARSSDSFRFMVRGQSKNDGLCLQVDGSGSMDEVARAIDMYLTEYEERVNQESAEEQESSVL